MLSVPLLVSSLCLAPLVARADDPPAPPPTPKLGLVESGALNLVTERSARIASAKKSLLRFEPEAFGGTVTVEKVLAKPGPVTAGTVIAQLKAKDFDKALSDLRIQVAEATERFAVAQEEATLARTSDAIAMERTERGHMLAEQRMRHSREYYFPKSLDLAKVRLQDQADGLKDQGDELAQLERMYSDATLESETKDIVIGRARRGFERSRTYFDYGQKDHELFLTFDHPNSVREAEDNLRYSQIGLDHLRIRQRLGAINARLGLASAARNLDDLNLRLTRMEGDAKRLTVTAPVDGLMALSLPEEGEPVGGRALMATIVDPSSLELTGNLDVEAIRILGPGSTLEVWLPSRPESSGQATITELSPLGSADGTGANYPFVASVQNRTGEWPLGAEARVVARKSIPGCTLVPAKAVKSSNGRWTVEVWTDGKRVEREVRIGASDGKVMQVITGLTPGEQVVLPDA